MGERNVPSIVKVGEMSYALLLLLNGAVNQDRCFKPKEYEMDLTPIGEAIRLIAEQVFGVSRLPFGGNVGTYHFLRKQTASSVVAKTLQPYYRSEYNRKERRRLAWLEIPMKYNSENWRMALDEDNPDKNAVVYIDHFKKILYQIACIGDVKMIPFLSELRKLIPHYMISGGFLPHEYMMYFGNRDYADQLIFLIYAIDGLIVKYG